MDSDRPFPTDPTLTPLLKERQFLVAVLTGAPGILLAYALAALAIIEVLRGELDVEGAGVRLAAIGGLLTVNPITGYLLARQYPRGKAAEAVGAQLAPLPAPADPSDLGITPQDVAFAQEEHAATGEAPILENPDAGDEG